MPPLGLAELVLQELRNLIGGQKRVEYNAECFHWAKRTLADSVEEDKRIRIT